MLHLILSRIPTDFFRQGLLRAAFNEAPMVDHAEPLVLLAAADHRADGTQMRQGANKALMCSVNSDQAQLAACSACMCAQACKAAPTLGRCVRDRGGGGVWFGSAHSSQQHGRATASKAQLHVLLVGPATAAHDRVLPAQARLLCVWAGA